MQNETHYTALMKGATGTTRVYRKLDAKPAGTISRLSLPGGWLANNGAGLREIWPTQEQAFTAISRADNDHMDRVQKDLEQQGKAINRARGERLLKEVAESKDLRRIIAGLDDAVRQSEIDGTWGSPYGINIEIAVRHLRMAVDAAGR